MKNMINTVKTAVTNTAITVRNKAQSVASRGYAFSRRALAGNSGEGYIDTAIKILIAVVLGALLLAGLYTLFGDTVLPTVTERVEEMFDYKG